MGTNRHLNMRLRRISNPIGFLLVRSSWVPGINRKPSKPRPRVQRTTGPLVQYKYVHYVVIITVQWTVIRNGLFPSIKIKLLTSVCTFFAFINTLDYDVVLGNFEKYSQWRSAGFLWKWVCIMSLLCCTCKNVTDFLYLICYWGMISFCVLMLPIASSHESHS